ncbi:MAG: FkbM family methyltransferase [Thiobacillaceae bacterium]
MSSFRNISKYIAIKSGLFSKVRSLEIYLNAFTLKVHDDDYRSIPSKINGGAIADIGANLGQSVISFRRLFPDSKIYAFEPNPACIKTLRRVSYVLKGNVEVKNFGIGNVSSTLKFYVPTLNGGIELLQEGSFDKSSFSSLITKQRINQRFDLKESDIQVTKLDSLNLSLSLLKIDVQGLEKQVLEGALQTITRDRPLIFLERDQKYEAEIDRFLADLGYVALKLKTNSLYVYQGITPVIEL